MLASLEGKQYFVGIGAQKAATTWLANYFYSHPQVGLSPLKELHYFDQIYRADLCSDFNKKYLETVRSHALEIKDDLSNAHIIELLRHNVFRLEMVNDPDRYRDFFQTFVKPENRVFGEITPSYSLLDEKGFSAIKRMFSDAKILFVLRDPVDRFWSQLRFKESLLGSDVFQAEKEVNSALRDPQFLLRTDYKRTLRELFKVFDESSVKIIFYENLLSAERHENEMRKITGFLGIDYHEGDIGNIINQSIVKNIPGDKVRVIAESFSHVYEDVFERFSDNIPENWRERFTDIGTC